MSIVKTETIQNEFKVTRNQDINLKFGELSLISSVNKMNGLFCVATCNSNLNYRIAVYDNSQGRITNHFQYNTAPACKK